MIDTEFQLESAILRHNIQFVVFDWDGTLMDSEYQIVSCLRAAIQDLGLEPMDDDTLKNIIGLGLRESIDALVPGQDDAFHSAFVEAYREHWFKSEGSRLFDGVREMLDVCKQHRLLLGVATGKSRRGLNKALGDTGLEAHFDATRCADETPSKPHPQMLIELMEELRVQPRHTLMVGDTEYDMEMASKAGVGKVAVTTGVHSEDRLNRHKPLVCLKSATDMPAWLTDAGILLI